MPQQIVTLGDNEEVRSAKVNAMLTDLKGSALTKAQRVDFRADTAQLASKKINDGIATFTGSPPVSLINELADNWVLFVTKLNEAFGVAFNGVSAAVVLGLANLMNVVMPAKLGPR